TEAGDRRVDRRSVVRRRLDVEPSAAEADADDGAVAFPDAAGTPLARLHDQPLAERRERALGRRPPVETDAREPAVVDGRVEHRVGDLAGLGVLDDTEPVSERRHASRFSAAPGPETGSGTGARG